MRRFNLDREKNLNKKNTKLKIIVGMMIIVAVAIISYSFAIFSTKSDNLQIISDQVGEFVNKDIILSVVVDGENAKSFPDSTSKKVFEKLECDNGTNGTWLNDEWKLDIKFDKPDKCTVYFISKIYTYEYQPNAQEFVAPYTGEYEIELWGAQGGDIDGYLGGKGAYTKGTIALNKGDKLYIYVGNTNISTTNYVLGFNGGGGYESAYGAGGGGATDVRLTKGNWDDFESLKSRIMVAAGGGGANNRNKVTEEFYYGAGNGGYGGGLIGGDGESLKNTHTNPETGKAYGWAFGTGATQVESGKRYDYNGDGTLKSELTYNNFGRGQYSQTGGGSGYYGGGGASHGGGGGGSSFISGHDGCKAIKPESTQDNIQHKDDSIHYSGRVFTNTMMKAGNEIMPNHEGNSQMTGNSGDGYAKITLVKINN